MEAEKAYERALEYAIPLKSIKLISQILNNLGAVHHRNCNTTLAFTYYHESLRLKKEFTKNYNIILYNLGILAFRLADFSLARKYFEESIENIKVTTNNKVTLASQYGRLSHLNILSGELEDAETQLFMAYQLLEGNNSEFEKSTLLLYHSILEYQRGEYFDAIDKLKRSLKIRRKIGDKITISEILFYLVEYLSEIGDPESLKYEEELHKISGLITNKLVTQRSAISALPRIETEVNEGSKADLFKIIQTVLKEQITSHEANNYLLLQLCKYLITEFSLFQHYEILNGIHSFMDSLHKIAYRQQNYPFLMQILFLEIELAILEEDYEYSQDLIEYCLFTAEFKGLSYSIAKVNLLQLDLEFAKSKKTSDFSEISIDEVILHLKQILTTSMTVSDIANIDSNQPHYILEMLLSFNSSSTHIAEMLQQLTTIDTIQKGKLIPLSSNLDIFELISTRTQLYQERANRKNVTLTILPIHSVKNSSIDTDRFQLTRVIDSIITELITRAEKESTIQVIFNSSHKLYLEIQFNLQEPSSYLQIASITHNDLELQCTLMKRKSIKLPFAKQLLEFLGGDLRLGSKEDSNSHNYTVLCKIPLS